MKISSYRDQEWLESLLAHIWNDHFSDVEQVYEVRVRYGRKAKQRLGSISVDRNNPDISVITINSIYQDLKVPEYVIKATIVHELTHYAHGFNSPHGQKHRHPHSGGVIRAEFAERGLEELYMRQKRWLKANWADVVMKYFPNQTSRRRSSGRTTFKTPWWFREI